MRRLSLFGSRQRGESRKGSDIDLLVEFAVPVGLFELVRLQQHLEQCLGLPVDLVTPNALSKYIRSDVLSSAEMVYGGEYPTLSTTFQTPPVSSR